MIFGDKLALAILKRYSDRVITPLISPVYRIGLQSAHPHYRHVPSHLLGELGGDLGNRSFQDIQPPSTDPNAFVDGYGFPARLGISTFRNGYRNFKFAIDLPCTEWLLGVRGDRGLHGVGHLVTRITFEDLTSSELESIRQRLG
jgi:hypothetical protein